jgi:choline dehydrogenase-like flavoprotein
MSAPVDVVIVGAGVGGAIASTVLAEAGLRVVCLEQGSWTPRERFPHFDADWEWRRLNDWSTAANVRQWPQDYPIDTEDEVTLMWNGVGGSSTVYTGTWPRFRPSDFRKGTEHGQQPDWPLTYEDLAPWYEANDRVCGISGVLGDPAIPAREPFQTGPLPPGSSRAAMRGFEALGWHWWPMPNAILGEDFDGRPACNHCGNCQSGCPRGSLNSMTYSWWPRALRAGVELVENARVTRIETNENRLATDVEYVDPATGLRKVLAARHFIVSANGVGTPRLLLASASDSFPTGLANSSDHVGRNLMHHGLSIVEAWVDEPLETHKGFVSAQLICEEFAETDISRGFINGFTLHIVRMNGAGYQAHGSHSGNVAPWGRTHHDWFRTHFDHGFGILCVGDDLPLPTNRVTLSESMIDSDGIPAPKITYGLHANDAAMMDYAVDRAVELAQAAGAIDIKVNRWRNAAGKYTPPAWHLLGTCRLGDDPATSVVDQWGRSWDVPNLSIMDGSVLPTGGAVNPTSTIGALTLRNATHLAAELIAGR